jgi:hypothetical protein
MHTLSLLRAGKLAGIKRLDLACQLTEFPREIFQLSESLEILNLSNNALNSLPDDLPTLHKLRIIFCSENNFTELPEVLGRCPNIEMIGFKSNQISKVSASALPAKLRWLVLTDNKITELPHELGNCTALQKLMLAGNKLRDLPASMAACTKLELLRISANCFTSLPNWLLSLPRLAWLAYAGNPLTEANETAAISNQKIPQIDWYNLNILQQLGEGASGTIYHATHQLQGLASPVAVKMFKGEVTSDGLPSSEQCASIAAGAHAALIPAIGNVTGHPAGKSGLLMSLIPPSFVNLAGPPSLESCTRDCYTEQTSFSLASALNIALNIASVAQHLHTQGIIHGDLYAHNILWDEHNNCLLGDFGAASFTPQHDSQLTSSLERIEVRALACLLEELLERCSPQLENKHIVDALGILQQRCAQPEVSSRPVFSEITQNLTVLAQRINNSAVIND